MWEQSLVGFKYESISLLYASNEIGKHIDIEGVKSVKTEQTFLFICSLVTRQVSPLRRLCCFMFFLR